MDRTTECEKLIDYYNGHLDSREKVAFEQHLKECPECREELAEWEEMNAELVRGLDPVEPPAEMEDRIFSNIFGEDKNDSAGESTGNFSKDASEPAEPDRTRPKNSIYKTMIWPLAAALLLSLIGNVYLWTEQQETPSLSEVLLEEGETVSLAPTSDAPDMDATMAMHSDSGQQTLVLRGHNFTSLNEGEVYQIWLMRDEEPYRAGTLVPNNHGDGYVVFTLEEDEEINWDMIAITTETSPHNQVPEGDILMSAEF